MTLDYGYKISIMKHRESHSNKSRNTLTIKNSNQASRIPWYIYIYISEIFTISHPSTVPVSPFIRGQLKLNFYGIFPMNFLRINPRTLPLQILAARSIPSPLKGDPSSVSSERNWGFGEWTTGVYVNCIVAMPA